MRPKVSWAGLICRTDQCFQRQRLPYTCSIKPWNQSVRERGRLRGKGSGEKVSFKTRMEDPVKHADYRFRSRVRAWWWRRALWGGRLTRKGGQLTNTPCLNIQLNNDPLYQKSLITSCAHRYASTPCQLTISSYLFARWHLFRHVGYLRHQQQVDLWPSDLESGVRVTCDVGYLCANFSLPRPLCSRVRPDVHDRQTDRQTDVRQKHRLMPTPCGTEA